MGKPESRKFPLLLIKLRISHFIAVLSLRVVFLQMDLLWRCDRSVTAPRVLLEPEGDSSAPAPSGVV